MDNLQHEVIRTNGINLHAVVAGPEDGPLILLLHGFPEFWYCWRNQITPLAAAGFRVIAPDQRGYNLSDKPAGVDSYQWYQLTADVIGIIHSTGRKKAIVIGHDWGGTVGWYTAAEHPEIVDRMIIMNAPHPRVFRRHIRGAFSQKMKSWYMFFFQIPWLPEKLMSMRRWTLLRKSLIRTSRHGTFPEDVLSKYVEAWSQSGSIQSMVSWYRAMFRNKRKMKQGRIVTPTLLIWGDRDAFLRPEMIRDSVELCEKGSAVRLEGVSHWIQQEEPQRVNELILNFLQ